MSSQAVGSAEKSPLDVTLCPSEAELDMEALGAVGSPGASEEPIEVGESGLDREDSMP